jgi:hypothetical protein
VANPTTNYGFVLPTPTDLVTDLPADFDVALQGVDTRLKALQPGTTLGDLMYASATANTNTRLPIGTTGQVLKVAGGVPAWGTDVGGKVLQVVYGSSSTYTTTTSTSYVDTNLSATITPTSATSQVLVLVTQQGCGRDTTTAGEYMRFKLVRASTDILLITDIFAHNASAGTFVNNGNTMSANYLDSPATTSATTYKTQFHSGGGTQVVVQNYYVASANTTSTIILLEIGA